MNSKEFQAAFEDLVAMGLLRKTGRFEPDRNRVLQPVYVHIEFVPDEELTPEERLLKAACKQGQRPWSNETC